MNSPITGKPMSVRTHKSNITYRGMQITYSHHFYRCPDSGEKFTDTKLDAINIELIHRYWLSTRNPRKEKTKTEKILLDELNKYRSWYADQTVKKLGRTPDFKVETELLAKIELLKDLQKKL